MIWQKMKLEARIVRGDNTMLPVFSLNMEIQLLQVNHEQAPDHAHQKLLGTGR
jgi:hypothetical protein